jgi:hypothetical protein
MGTKVEMLPNLLVPGWMLAAAELSGGYFESKKSAIALSEWCWNTDDAAYCGQHPAEILAMPPLGPSGSQVSSVVRTDL